MAGLKDEIRGTPDGLRRGCTVGLVMQKLDKEDQEGLESVLTDASVPSTVIARILQARGYDIRETTIQRHRRAVCQCHRVSWKAPIAKDRNHA